MSVGRRLLREWALLVTAASCAWGGIDIFVPARSRTVWLLPYVGASVALLMWLAYFAWRPER